MPEQAVKSVRGLPKFALPNCNLNVSVISYLAPYPDLDRLADRISDLGITKMSDLLRHTEAELFEGMKLKRTQKVHFRKALKEGFLTLRP